jgi:hypothetical protein
MPPKKIQSPLQFDEAAQRLLYEWWYTYSQRLVDRIVEVCELTPDQEALIRRMYLKPNDFVIQLT